MVVVYMAGDNNLSEEMSGAFSDFGKTLSNTVDTSEKPSDIAILVYFDGNNPNTPTFYCDFTDQNDIVVEHIPDGNSGDSRSLGNFFKWCQKRYSPEHTALFLSGHSDGFQGISLLRDDSSGQAMKISWLRKTLENYPKYNNGRSIDILCFDSCVIGMAEIAYEFRKAADILIASQGFSF